LELVRDAKGNKKSFCRYTSKRKAKEKLSPLLGEAGDLVTKLMEKAKVLKGCFFFPVKCLGLSCALPDP